MAERVAFSDEIFRPLGEDAALAVFDDTRSWVDPRGYRLSDRVWLARQGVRDDIDRVLLRAIANGEDPISVARELERFLNPALAPKRNERGRLEPPREQPVGAITRTPRGGAGSYPARRLARTEVTRAFGQATRQAAALNPMVRGIQWRLSSTHRPERCNGACADNARRDPAGMGRGVYPVGDVPRFPSHPQDRCALLPVARDDVDAVVAQLRRELALNERPGNFVAFPTADDGRQVAQQGGTGLIARLVRVWTWLRGEEAA